MSKSKFMLDLDLCSNPNLKCDFEIYFDLFFMNQKL